MKRKIAALALLSVILPFSLAACSGSINDVNTTEATTETSTKISNGKNVYFAAPLFNKGEKDFNLEITKVLEEYGYNVFLPQRDGILAAEVEGKSEEELTQTIFDLDYSEVNKADIIFMSIDGRAPDEGACVELGIGYANGKRCYGVKTDTRIIGSTLEINPMISGCMIKIFENHDGDKLIEELRQYLSENAL